MKYSLEFYEKLGARKFQKVVFKAEQIKYKVLKPFSRIVRNYYEKRIDRIVHRKLKYEQDDTRRKQIILYYQQEKLRFRRELANEKNRNYHLDSLDPKQTLCYLEMNKKIHQNGIKSNVIWAILSIVTMIAFPGWIAVLASICLGLQGIGIFINFECINLQNYNITRIESRMDRLSRIQKRRIETGIQKYGKAAEVISTLLENQMELPSKEAIANQLTNLEQLKQMRALVEEATKQKLQEQKGDKITCHY